MTDIAGDAKNTVSDAHSAQQAGNQSDAYTKLNADIHNESKKLGGTDSPEFKQYLHEVGQQLQQAGLLPELQLEMAQGQLSGSDSAVLAGHASAQISGSNQIETINYPNGRVDKFSYDPNNPTAIAQISETGTDGTTTVFKPDDNGHWGPVGADGKVTPNGAGSPEITADGHYTFQNKDGSWTLVDANGGDHNQPNPPDGSGSSINNAIRSLFEAAGLSSAARKSLFPSSDSNGMLSGLSPTTIESTLKDSALAKTLTVDQKQYLQNLQGNWSQTFGSAQSVGLGDLAAQAGSTDPTTYLKDLQTFRNGLAGKLAGELTGLDPTLTQKDGVYSKDQIEASLKQLTANDPTGKASEIAALNDVDKNFNTISKDGKTITAQDLADYTQSPATASMGADAATQALASLTVVKPGEGEWQSAARLLGPGASNADILSLTNILVAQHEKDSGRHMLYANDILVTKDNMQTLLAQSPQLQQVFNQVESGQLSVQNGQLVHGSGGDAAPVTPATPGGTGDAQGTPAPPGAPGNTGDVPPGSSAPRSPLAVLPNFQLDPSSGNVRYIVQSGDTIQSLAQNIAKFEGISDPQIIKQFGRDIASINTGPDPTQDVTLSLPAGTPLNIPGDIAFYVPPANPLPGTGWNGSKI